MVRHTGHPVTASFTVVRFRLTYELGLRYYRRVELDPDRFCMVYVSYTDLLDSPVPRREALRQEDVLDSPETITHTARTWLA